MTEDEELESHRAVVRVGVFAGIARRRVIRQRRVIALVAGAGLLLAAGTAIGAAKLVTVTQMDIDHNIACYPTASLEYEPIWFQDLDEPPVNIPGNCELLWREAPDIGHRPPGVDPGAYPGAFAECLGPDGTAAGFPLWDDTETGERVCERLGLPIWDPSISSGGAEVLTG